MTVAEPGFRSDDMRISNEDRDVAVGILCDAYAVGWIGLDEIRDRASAAYRARTWGDLRPLTSDLAPEQARARFAAAAPAPPAAGPRRGPKRAAVPALLIVLALLAMAAPALIPTAPPLAGVCLIVMSLSALFGAGLAAAYAGSGIEAAAGRGGSSPSWP